MGNRRSVSWLTGSPAFFVKSWLIVFIGKAWESEPPGGLQQSQDYIPGASLKPWLAHLLSTVHWACRVLPQSGLQKLRYQLGHTPTLGSSIWLQQPCLSSPRSLF